MELIFQADIALIFRFFLLGQRKSTKEYFVYFKEIFCRTTEKDKIFAFVFAYYICFMELIFQADIALIFRFFLLGQRKSTKEYFVYFKEIFCRTSGKRQKSAYGCPVKSIPN